MDNGLVRWPSAIFAVTTLLWGFVQAPFLHIHAEDLDHDPGAGPTHTHVRAIHLESAPAIEALTADDDAIDLVWSISVPSLFQFVFPPELIERVTMEPSISPETLVAPVQLHSHDPPALSLQNPRPPPA